MRGGDDDVGAGRQLEPLGDLPAVVEPGAGRRPVVAEEIRLQRNWGLVWICQLVYFEACKVNYLNMMDRTNSNGSYK